MLEKIKNLGNLPLVIILVVVIIIAIVLSIFKGQKSEKTNANTYVGDVVNQEKLEEDDEQEEQIEQEEEIIVEENIQEIVDETEQKEENVDAKYFIKVNYGQNVVTIYTKDGSGNYTVPYKAMVCSTGTATPKSGTYTIPSGTYSRGTWGYMFGDVWAQYFTRIHKSILFHSVPYTERNKWSLEYWEYDKLGTAASMGCIRLTVEDAKWIYNNCPAGTKVEFYSDSNPGPLGKPSAQKISEEEEVRGWDPTDPDGTNPWKTYTPKENEQNTENTNTNTDTNKKPSTTTKPTTPTTPSTPQAPNETPNEGEGTGSETTTPPSDNSGNETTPPSEGESSGENQDGSGLEGEETTNPKDEGTTGEGTTGEGTTEEGADNPSGEGTTEEKPNVGDNTSGENSGEGSQENKEEQPDSDENE